MARALSWLVCVVNAVLTLLTLWIISASDGIARFSRDYRIAWPFFVMALLGAIVGGAGGLMKRGAGAVTLALTVIVAGLVGSYWIAWSSWPAGHDGTGLVWRYFVGGGVAVVVVLACIMDAWSIMRRFRS